MDETSMHKNKTNKDIKLPKKNFKKRLNTYLFTWVNTKKAF